MVNCTGSKILRRWNTKNRADAKIMDFAVAELEDPMHCRK